MKRDHSSWRKRCHYRFDNFITRGNNSIFISLLVIFCSVLIAITLLRIVFLVFHPAESESIDASLRHLYITFLHLTDPGTMITDLDTSPWFKLAAVIAGLTGIVLLSMLIAVITTTLDRKLRQLMKGRSRVIEKGHTLILGWNDRGIEVLRELIIANESEKSPVVVILSKEPREAVEDYLKTHLRHRKNTRIVTRSGNPSSLTDLDIVAIKQCASIIALATCDIDASKLEKSTSDAYVIKTVLAVYQSRKSVGMCHTAAELFATRNRHIIESISPNNIITLNAKGILSKLIVQTSRSIGLSVVLGEILSFQGCEMYFYNNPKWKDKTFAEISLNFKDGVPMGICKDDVVHLNPDNTTRLDGEEELLILAEDDSTIHFEELVVAEHRSFSLPQKRLQKKPERELIIGWSAKASLIIRDYANYLEAGSEINIMYSKPNEKLRREVQRLSNMLTSLKINLFDLDPLKAEELREVQPFNYDNILILSQGGIDASSDKTDSETMIILLLLRSIFRDNNKEPTTKIITEVLNSENQDLISSTGVNDFIISNRMVSMMLAQVSEDPRIKQAYDELFCADGSEIYLKPLSLYFESFPVDVSYASLIMLCQQRHEICLGVKLKAFERDLANNFGVELIPAKATRFNLCEHDTLIVLAEDET